MQMSSISCENAEHYTWGERCDGWYLTKNKKLCVIEEQMPPGTSETLHYHKQSQQFFYVISGEAVMEATGREILLRVGEGVQISPGTNHRIKNLSRQAIRFLVISEPPSHGDRVELKGAKR
jgi:mannose-6-phosphate isomerase-like protein (cupin superfamily)